MQWNRAVHTASEWTVSGSKNSGGNRKIRINHLNLQGSFTRTKTVCAGLVVSEPCFEIWVATGHGDHPMNNIEGFARGQSLLASERCAFNVPDDFCVRPDIDEDSRFTTDKRPTMP